MLAWDGLAGPALGMELARHQWRRLDRHGAGIPRPRLADEHRHRRLARHEADADRDRAVGQVQGRVAAAPVDPRQSAVLLPAGAADLRVAFLLLALALHLA